MDGQIFYIDSNKRKSGTHSDFVYDLNINNPERMNAVCVLAMNIPLSYYMVDVTNNKFVLTELGVDTDIFVPIGNYNAISFRNIVVGLLNAASPNHWTYNIVLNNSNNEPNIGKYVFSVSGNSGQPSFRFIEIGLNEQFGFDPGETVTFDGDTLISKNVIKFIPEDTLYLRSDITTNNEQVLQAVYHNNHTLYSNITWICNQVDHYSKPFKATQGTSFRFWLTDENAKHIMDLNGLNMVITILIYRKNELEHLVKDYLKYKIKQDISTNEIQQDNQDNNAEDPQPD